MWARAWIAVALLAACSTTASTTYKTYNSDIGGAISASSVGVGDVLSVRVYLHPDLEGDFVIAPEGTINFPLAGEVNVEGLDVTQIGHVLRDRLAAGYIREPQVIVTLKALNSKKVYVLGQVRTPGRYAFTEDMTIVEAVTLAGGFANLAERNYTIVTRGTRRIPIPVEKIMQGLASNFPLQPGDIVYVPQSIL